MVSTKQTIPRDLSIWIFYNYSSKILKWLSLLHKAWDILGIPRILIWCEKETSRTHLLYSSLFCQQTWHTATPHIWAPHLEIQVFKTKTFYHLISFRRHTYSEVTLNPQNKQSSTFPTEVNHYWLPFLFIFLRKQLYLMDRDSIYAFVLAHTKSKIKQKTFFIVPDCGNWGEGVAEGFFYYFGGASCIVKQGGFFSWLRYMY